MTDQIKEQDVELDETEIEEAHDPKNAEAQSIASVASAEDKGPKAKARKGDKSNGESMSKVTAGNPEKASAGMKAEDVKIYGDFSDDINALVESEATLSEEFKAKTAIIFEAALKSKLSEEIDRLEESYKTELNEEVAAVKAELVEKVDSYLNYVVENWMEDNKLAIQNGLRTEIAENFMTKLKDLFTESYIEVPESKVDLVDDLAEQVAELEEAANEATAKAIALGEELVTYKRQAIIREHSVGLAETQIDKLAALVEDIEFEDEETFTNKVSTIKESYFKKNVTVAVEDEVEESYDNLTEASDVMAQYLATMKKLNNKK